MNKWNEITKSELNNYITGSGEFTQSLFDSMKHIAGYIIDHTPISKLLMSLGESKEDLEMIIIEETLRKVKKEDICFRYLYKAMKNILYTECNKITAEKRDRTKTDNNIEPEETEEEVSSDFDKHSYRIYESETSGSIINDKEYVNWVCDWWDDNLNKHTYPCQRKAVKMLVQAARDISNGNDKLFETETPNQRFYPPELNATVEQLSKAKNILSRVNKQLDE